MKKCRWLLLMLMILCLTGCGQGTKKAASGVEVYYTNETRSTLLSSTVKINHEDTVENVQELWQEMQQPPSGNEMYSLIPEGVEMQGLDLTDGQLTVTFNTAYNEMDSISEVLLRAGFVEGVTQFSEVRTVVFHIGDAVLKNHAGEQIGAMTKGSFINNPVGINSYQYASLTLYFSNAAGDKIVKEMRNVHYSTNTTVEKVVLEQLISGPLNRQLRAILTEDVKLLDIQVEDMTCTLNFNEAFQSAASAAGVNPEVMIYCIVDSLCDVLGVDKVQFTVEGSSDVLVGDSLSLAGPFHRNSEIIEATDTSEEIEESEVTEQQLGEPQIGL